MKPEMADAIVWARGVLATRTPGEWRADEDDGEVATNRSVVCDTSARHRDATVIALAVNTHPTLLDVLAWAVEEAADHACPVCLMWTQHHPHIDDCQIGRALAALAAERERRQTYGDAPTSCPERSRR
jgi:hypothetical protein